jgi:hypothetical protein
LRINANNIPDDLAEIVAACDGRRSLRSIVTSVMQGRVGDPSRYEARIESAFRRLVEMGFLVPMPESP